jgi:hypothetical protein
LLEPLQRQTDKPHVIYSDVTYLEYGTVLSDASKKLLLFCVLFSIIALSTSGLPGTAQNPDSLISLNHRVTELEDTVASLECVAKGDDPTTSDCHKGMWPQVTVELIERRVQSLDQRLQKVQMNLLEARKSGKTKP